MMRRSHSRLLSEDIHGSARSLVQAFLAALGELCVQSGGGFAQHLCISSRLIRDLELSLPQTV